MQIRGSMGEKFIAAYTDAFGRVELPSVDGRLDRSGEEGGERGI